VLVLAALAAALLAYMLVHATRPAQTNPADWQAPASDPWRAYLAPDSACPGAGDYLAPAAAQKRAMICLVDYARTRYGSLHRGWPGRGPLPENALLTRAGTLKSALLLRCDQFTHYPCKTPFATVFREAGYGRGAPVVSVGENLAYGQQDEGSPRATLDGWLNSPEHRQNLFTAKWRAQGLALAHPQAFVGYSDVTLWVSEFGNVS